MLVGAVSARRLGVVAIDPSSFDPAVPRDAEALAALRAAGVARAGAAAARARAGGRQTCRARRPRAGLARRCSTLLAGAFGLLHARDLQIPALSTPRLAAIAAAGHGAGARGAARGPAGRTARARAGGARRRLARRRPAGPRLARRSAASPGSSRTRPRPGCRSCCRSRADERPELRAAVLVALFAWLAALAWLSLARPRPLAAALLALRAVRRSARPSTTCRSYPWRALLAGALLLGLPVHRPAGGRRAADRASPLAALALAGGAALAAVPARVAAGGAAVDDLDVLARADSDASSVDLVWDMRYQPLSFGPKPVEVLQVRAPRPSYWRARRALRLRRPALRTRALQAIVEHARARRRRARAGSRRRDDRCAPRCRSRRWSTPSSSPPASPCATSCRPRPGRSISPRTPPRSSASPRRRGSATSPRASTATPRRARCARSRPRYPASVVGGDLSFAGEVLPAFGTSRPRARPGGAVPVAPRRPAVGCVAGRLREGAAASRAERPRRTRRSSRWRPGCARRAPTTSTRACPSGPDALARWAAGGTAGLLPDVRRLAGRARAPLGRAGARRRGIRPGRSARRRLPRDRSRRARLGRGLVPRLRLAAVRRHAGTRSAGAARRRPRRRSTARRRRRRATRRRSAGAAAAAAARAPARRARERRGARARAAGRAWWDSALGVRARGRRRAARGARARSSARSCELALPRDPARRARQRVRAFAADQGVELGSRPHAARARAAPSSGASASEAATFADALERSAYGGRRARGTTPRSRPRRAGCCARCAPRWDARRRLRGVLSLLARAL